MKKTLTATFLMLFAVFVCADAYAQYAPQPVNPQNQVQPQYPPVPVVYDNQGNPIPAQPQQPMYVPVLDANGNQQFDVNGQPIYRLVYPGGATTGTYATPQRVLPHNYAMYNNEASDGVFGVARGKMTNVFANVRLIVFILGGFGLIFFAVLAIFGKPNWKGFAILAVALFIVAVAGAVIEFATGADAGLTNTIQTQPHQAPYPGQVQQQPYVNPQPTGTAPPVVQ